MEYEDLFPPITKEEEKVARRIASGTEGVTVLRCILNDIPIAVVAYVETIGLEYKFFPYAIAITNELMRLITPPPDTFGEDELSH